MTWAKIAVILAFIRCVFQAEIHINQAKPLQTSYIYTMAGNGSSGYYGDGLPAVQAEFNHIAGLSFDTIKNVLYIVDQYNHRIRMVDLKTNIITTFAGYGTPGYSGDGGLAIYAQLNSPGAVYADPNSNFVYIGDTHNSRIRVVDRQTGVINSLTQFRPPVSIVGFASDKWYIYMSDIWNQRVLAMDRNTGAVYTSAGNGQAGFSGDGGLAYNAQINNPYGLFCDTINDKLYIADSSNNRIRVVDRRTNIINTFAGNGNPGQGGDGGFAMNAQLNSPHGVTYSAQYNVVFIADTMSNKIRVVGSDNKIYTFAGTGTPGYSGDGGWPTSAMLYNPNSVEMNDNKMYLADTVNVRVRLINITSW